jgi:L-ribulokinase
MQRPYAIGIDFGTMSARAVLVDSRNGRELSSAIHEYRHGVIEKTLPGEKAALKPRTALQHPADYLEALEKTIPALLRKGRVSARRVGGLGTDFTACTVLPVRSDGTPLCFDQRLARNPHAWPKLWKHHAAQPEANAINEIGMRRTEEFIAAYGGKYSSEWFFSKVLETLREAPQVYHSAGYFTEACDWIVWQLSGRQTRNVSAAGFKGMRVHKEGSDWTYPSAGFFRELHRDLEHVVSEKLGGDVVQLGTAVAGLTPEMAKRLKLDAGIPVCAGNIDAHAGVPACGVTEPGSMVMIMGTSTCHLLIGESRQNVEGICGVVQDGIAPGSWGYEAGQAGVGDLFAWYAENAPASVTHTAEKRRASVHEILSNEAAKLRAGESGLLALDWWNGNRSVLVNADLTGLILGLTLHTKPAEIYRALMESTAFGTRVILDAFKSKGLPMKELVASGGLAQKNPVLMQIYADVLQQPVTVASSAQTSAFGSAMWASVAAGLHLNIRRAAKKMARRGTNVFKPQRRNAAPYERLFAEYMRLHDQFGRTAGNSMKQLREIQQGAFQ